MKAPYDTTCDIIDGPGTATPGNVRHAAVPCRYVVDTRVYQREKWLDQDAAYITMDEDDVHAVFSFTSPPDYTIEDQLCDRIAIPSGAAAGYTVLWTEEVLPDSGVSYYRAHVRIGT